MGCELAEVGSGDAPIVERSRCRDECAVWTHRNRAEVPDFVRRASPPERLLDRDVRHRRAGLESDVRVGGPRAEDDDKMDFNQAFADWTVYEDGGNSLTIRGGRQELEFGASRLLSARPITVSLTSTGAFERYAADGTLLTQVGMQSSQGVVVAQQGTEAAYSIYGVTDLQDQQTGTNVTIKGADITREEGCCHPTSGTLEISSADVPHTLAMDDDPLLSMISDTTRIV